MKKICTIIFLLVFVSSEVFAAAAKIYDKDGFRLGICKKNGDLFEAYDLDENPIKKDALGNEVPGKELYFYDISGNLRKFTNEKRTIAPVNFEIDGKIYKGPLYRRPR